jgi:Winged helix DNA-binding domain
MPERPSPIRPSGVASSSEIARFRLERHHLLGQQPADPVTICRDTCGAQAQMMSPAYLQLWTRNHAITRTEIENALWKSRTLVKTSLMRQTLHLIPSDEFSLYISALRRSRVDAVLRVMKRVGVTAEEGHGLTAEIMKAMGDRALTQPEIRAAVRIKASKRVRSWMDKVWSIIRIPISEGLLCYGSGEGNEVKFIRTDQWLKLNVKPVREPEAQSSLLRKYLRAYGPATLHDFAHWSGIPIAEVRPLRALLGDELTEIEAEKQNCLLLRDDLELLKRKSREKTCVRLLPHFDPYLLAHREKDHLLEVKHYKKVYRNQGWISPVVLVDGAIAGTWSYKIQGKQLKVSIELFGGMSREARAGIEREAQSLAGFFNKSCEILVKAA